MKRFIYILAITPLLCTRLLALPPSFTESEEYSEDDYYTNVGLSTTSSNFSALSASMVAWGVGLAAGITALTLLIDPSSSESGGGGGGGSTHSHSH